MSDMSRGTQIAIAASILLPYGTVTANTMIFTANQFWLFPLWTYIHDFGNWMGFGAIIPPFLPSFSYPVSILGVVFFILGIYLSIQLNQVHSGKRERKSLQSLVIYFLLFQIISTILVSSTIWGVSVILVVPLPLQSVFILLLSRQDSQYVSKPFEQ